MEVLIPILLLIVLTWLVLVRPQRKRQQAQNAMMSELQVGSEILTAGGVYGRVKWVGDDELTVEIAPGTNVKLDKRAVAMIVPEDEPQAASATVDGER